MKINRLIRAAAVAAAVVGALAYATIPVTAATAEPVCADGQRKLCEVSETCTPHFNPDGSCSGEYSRYSKYWK